MEDTDDFEETEAGFRVRLWFVLLWAALPVDHRFNKNKKHYISDVLPARVEIAHLVPAHVDIVDIAPLKGTIPGFRVIHNPPPAAKGARKAEPSAELIDEGN